MSADTDFVYLFSYFKGRGDGLHLAWSEDALHWIALNNDEPFVIPDAGPEKLMRDPFVLPAKDGIFHLVWTAGWRGSGIGYAHSKDLVSWSPQRYLPLMEHEPDAENCWAPEIFYDEPGDQFIVYWASSIPGRFPQSDHMGDEGLNHRMYCATTPDFKTFSPTRLFYDGGFNVIDATLVKDNDRYLLFMKNETSNPCEKNIRVAVGDNIFSDFKKVSPPLTGAYWAEGPSALKVNGKWIVYFDKYKTNQFGAVSSSDLVHWQDISDSLSFPSGCQHGSVAPVARDRLRHLL
jgi:beta-xylosidase